MVVSFAVSEWWSVNGGQWRGGQWMVVLLGYTVVNGEFPAPEGKKKGRGNECQFMKYLQMAHDHSATPGDQARGSRRIEH